MAAPHYPATLNPQQPPPKAGRRRPRGRGKSRQPVFFLIEPVVKGPAWVFPAEGALATPVPYTVSVLCEGPGPAPKEPTLAQPVGTAPPQQPGPGKPPRFPACTPHPRPRSAFLCPIKKPSASASPLAVPSPRVPPPPPSGEAPGLQRGGLKQKAPPLCRPSKAAGRPAAVTGERLVRRATGNLVPPCRPVADARPQPNGPCRTYRFFLEKIPLRCCPRPLSFFRPPRFPPPFNGSQYPHRGVPPGPSPSVACRAPVRPCFPCSTTVQPLSRPLSGLPWPRPTMWFENPVCLPTWVQVFARAAAIGSPLGPGRLGLGRPNSPPPNRRVPCQPAAQAGPVPGCVGKPGCKARPPVHQLVPKELACAPSPGPLSRWKRFPAPPPVPTIAEPSGVGFSCSFSAALIAVPGSPTHLRSASNPNNSTLVIN